MYRYSQLFFIFFFLKTVPKSESFAFFFFLTCEEFFGEYGRTHVQRVSYKENLKKKKKNREVRPRSILGATSTLLDVVLGWVQKQCDRQSRKQIAGASVYMISIPPEFLCWGAENRRVWRAGQGGLGGRLRVMGPHRELRKLDIFCAPHRACRTRSCHFSRFSSSVSKKKKKKWCRNNCNHIRIGWDHKGGQFWPTGATFFFQRLQHFA